MSTIQCFYCLETVTVVDDWGYTSGKRRWDLQIGGEGTREGRPHQNSQAAPHCKGRSPCDKHRHTFIVELYSEHKR